MSDRAYEYVFVFLVASNHFMLVLSSMRVFTRQ
jgi:hypothetical protein